MKTHNFWLIRRFDALSREAIDTKPVKNGCTYQGRFEGQLDAAECCTELGADDEWESADAEVLLMLVKAFLAVLTFLALLWMTKP